MGPVGPASYSYAITIPAETGWRAYGILTEFCRTKSLSPLAMITFIVCECPDPNPERAVV
ncbi:hypothetical protein T265_10566 [Opisthorchis viverrini]|uniref:Uncharacterized protein n=1 Tax=Opisthorchis viverrini TaxID=6198 RepID=A0A074ZCU5_OPIVI|nr:hypothetical protein T265_10566 [Opisthorchis viverrini]KER21015.1 hypothetical protein T265_10566 [Opisthorchis viverrini]